MKLWNSIEMLYSVLHAENDSGDGTAGRHLLSEAKQQMLPGQLLFLHLLPRQLESVSMYRGLC